MGQILLSSITYEQFEIAQGGSAADTLTGPNNATQWNLSGPNSGNVTIGSATIQFTAIENLTSGAGNDTVIVEGGGSLSGTLNLGAGTDVLDLSDTFGALDVLNATNRSVVGKIGIFTATERVLGNSHPDSRVVGSNVATAWTIDTLGRIVVGSVIYEQFNQIAAGSLADTITGPNVTTNWMVNSLGGGSVLVGSTSVVFSGIENLTGGTANDLL